MFQSRHQNITVREGSSEGWGGGHKTEEDTKAQECEDFLNSNHFSVFSRPFRRVFPLKTDQLFFTMTPIKKRQ